MTLYAPIRSRTASKIEDFAKLPQGWHYGNGGPVAAPVIGLAKRVCGDMILVGLTRTDAFAGEDGTVLVTAYHHEHYVSVAIEPTLVMTLTHEADGVECCSEESDDLSKIASALYSVAREIWNLSASFIPEISTTIVAGSTIWPLNAQLAGTECLFSTARVENRLVA